MKLIIFGIFLFFISSQAALTCNEIRSAFFIKNNCDADDTCKTVCDDLKNSFKSQGCSCDTVTGTVIDGPLENALVFPDINENGIQDADEPWTITNSKGEFVLKAPPGSPIVAKSTANTTDTSTGEMVRDLTLKAPAGAAVITPLSDLVYEISKRNSLNTNDAVLKATQTLGLSDEIDVLDLNPFDPTSNANASEKARLAIVFAIIETADPDEMIEVVTNETKTVENSIEDLIPPTELAAVKTMMKAETLYRVVISSITLAQTKNATFSSEATTIQTASFQQVKNVDCYSVNVCVANWDPTNNGCDATEYKLEDTGCNDGLDTTKDDVCDGAGQCAGTTITCDANTQCATYSPNGEGCATVHKADDTPCDDGSDTTKNDLCDGAGQCAGTNITCDANTQCTTYQANGEDCDTVHKANGIECDDGSDATAGDVCGGDGQCAGTNITCDANTQCTTYQANGEDCDTVHKANGIECDDGSSSTKNDLCDGLGTCSGTDITCDANTQCTTYSPNGVDCVISHKADGTPCDDGSDATAGDVCGGDGQCAGTDITCDANTQCTTYQANGEDCDTVHKANGIECDDGSSSTKNDLCDGLGTCSGTDITCDANTQCTTYQANGEDCDTVHKADGTPCDDGSSSTINDVCDGTGQCIGCSENDPNYNVPGCCGNVVVINTNSCDNDHRCAGLAFAESLNECSGCEAGTNTRGTNTRITQNNVGNLDPPAILCSNTTSSGSSNYSRPTNSSAKYTCNDGAPSVYWYQNADCSGAAVMQMDLSTTDNCVDEDDGTSVQMSCNDTYITGLTKQSTDCTGDVISSRTVQVDECQVWEGIDAPTSDACGCFGNNAEEEQFCEGGFSTVETCEANVGRCHWGPSENSACRAGSDPADDGHSDNTEITYKTQEGGCPEYNETAADCNEGENEADSPCKCTSCRQIETYMIKNGQFCINGNWSLN